MVVSLKLVNDGSTPAYKCVHVGNIIAVELKHARADVESSRKSKPVGEPAAIALHASQTGDYDIRNFEPFTIDDMQRLRRGELILFAFGYVEYRDTFKRRQKSEFCYSVDKEVFSTGQPKIDWILAPFHNDAT